MNTKIFHLHGLKVGAVALGAVLTAVPSFAQLPEGQLPYETGFEAPTFSPGLLGGQDIWVAGWEGPGHITSTNPKTGSQSVEIFGDEMDDWYGPTSYNAASFMNYDGFALGTPVVDLSVDAQLVGPSTPGYDYMSVNVFSHVGAWWWYLLPEVYLSSSGDAWISGCDFEGNYHNYNIKEVPLGKYHRLGIRYNLATRLNSVFLDGDLFAVHPTCDYVPPDEFFSGVGLIMHAPDFSDNASYTGYFDNLSVRNYMPVPLDVKPGGCPNPLNVKSKGVLPAAILGTETLDVTEIDPASIRLVPAQGGAGIAPLRWSLEDVGTPYEPLTGKESAYDCNAFGPDGYRDLSLKFDRREIAALPGVTEGQPVKLFTVTGNLKEAFGGTPILGEDVVKVKF